MRRRLKQAAVAFVVAIAAAQLVRPSRTNPPTDVSRTLQSQPAMKALGAVVERSCGDCHSNATSWSSWYAQVAPVSWLMAHEVAAGRRAINFSEWTGYSPEQQRILLAASCDDAASGKMPGPYPLFKPDTRLSTQDIQTICATAREIASSTPGPAR